MTTSTTPTCPQCEEATAREARIYAALQAALFTPGPRDRRTLLLQCEAAMVTLASGGLYIVPKDVAQEIEHLRAVATVPHLAEDPTPPHVCGNFARKLQEFPSWRLERLSPNTYPQDIGTRCPVARGMEAQLKLMMREGHAFRCRIGRHAYCYARNIPDAVDGAIQNAATVEAPP